MTEFLYLVAGVFVGWATAHFYYTPLEAGSRTDAGGPTPGRA